MSSLYRPIFMVLVLFLAHALAQTQTNSFQQIEEASMSFFWKVVNKNVANLFKFEEDYGMVFSPLAIHHALSMLYRGASGVTEQELASILGYDKNGDFSYLYSNLIASLQSDKNVNVNIVSTFFASPNVQMKQVYRQEMQSVFKAETRTLNNFNHPNGARRNINEYVSRQTSWLIPDLIPTNGLDANTQLVLVNAMSFIGQWDMNFESIPDVAFQTAAGITYVNMLTGAHKIPYKFVEYRANYYQVAEIPVSGGRFGFTMIFSHDIAPTGMFHLEEAFIADENTLKNVFLSDMKETMMNVTFPEFSIPMSLNLNDTLEKVAPTAFNKDTAEYAWMSDKDIWVDEVFHGSSFQVNANGIGQQATTVDFAGRAELFEPSFIAIRPFMFFLRDLLTGQFLYQGKYTGLCGSCHRH